MSLRSAPKALFHSALRRFGYRVMPIAMTSDDESTRALLREYGIDLILDVGANMGQFAKSILRLGYTGRIVSFEPLAAAYAVLRAESREHPNWEIAERCCVGDRDAEVEINVSENSISSSLLPISAEHVRISREAGYVGVEKVSMKRLDAIAESYLDASRAPMLKIDVQGYEQHVLDGATRILPRLRGLQVELSLEPVYEGQRLMLPMLAELESLGFALHRLTPTFVEPRNGRWLQVDGLFFRAA